MKNLNKKKSPKKMNDRVKKDTVIAKSYKTLVKKPNDLKKSALEWLLHDSRET